jgi:Lipase (class 3)
MQVVVSFRGTETTKLQDIRTDIQFRPAIYTEGGPGAGGDGGRLNWWQRKFGATGQRQATVHAGFLTAWRSVQAQVEAAVRACQLSAPTGAWIIEFAGHSLGGALAVLGAASCVANGCAPLSPEASRSFENAPARECGALQDRAEGARRVLHVWKPAHVQPRVCGRIQRERSGDVAHLRRARHGAQRAAQHRLCARGQRL